MPKRHVSPSPEAMEAIWVLGQQVRLGRQHNGWSAANLAARIGVHPNTISAIEAGRPGTSIGTVLHAATAVGVRLFGAEHDELVALRRRGEDILALLPSRVFERGDDDDVPRF